MKVSCRVIAKKVQKDTSHLSDMRQQQQSSFPTQHSSMEGEIILGSFPKLTPSNFSQDFESEKEDSEVPLFKKKPYFV